MAGETEHDQPQRPDHEAVRRHDLPAGAESACCTTAPARPPAAVALLDVTKQLSSAPLALEMLEPRAVLHVQELFQTCKAIGRILSSVCNRVGAGEERKQVACASAWEEW